MEMKALLAVVAVATLVCAAPATGAELLGGVFAHDVTFLGKAVGRGAAGREGGADIALGIRSDRLQALHVIGRPQAHAFVSANTDNTSNFVAAGLSWPISLTERLYIRPGVGLAYTDGKTGLPAVNAPGLSPQETQRRLHLYNTRIDFGSKVLFEPEISLGWRFSPRWAAELTWVHLSNGQIFHRGKNQGLDDAGMRLIYTF